MNPEERTEGTRVCGPDGQELGEINRYVLDPSTNEVTHIVIRGGGQLPQDRLVPFDRLREGEGGRLVLDEDLRDFDRLPLFEETHFIELRHGLNGCPAYYWYPPYGNSGAPAYGFGPFGFPLSLTGQTIPTGTLTLQQGIAVTSSDGEQVGLVKQLLVDESAQQVTHFLVSQDLSFHEQKLVPVKWVRSVDEDRVHLDVSTQVLEDLPAYEE